MIIMVGDDMVDLYPKAGVFYTVQRVDIGNLTARQVSYSNSFTAPWTENNERIFGFAKSENTRSPVIYRLRNCKILNGIEVTKNSVLYITVANQTEFSLQIFENIFDYFLAVSDKKIGELEPIASSGWRASDIDSARTATDGLVSALINWGVPLSDEDFFMPSFYYHTLITAILEYTGLEIEGDILTDERFTDLIVPYGAEEFEYPETYYSQFNFYNPRMGDQAISGSTSETTLFGQNASEYLHGTYFARVSVGGITWAGGTKLWLYLRKNGTLVASAILAQDPTPGASAEIQWTGFVDDGDVFNFYIYAEATGPGISYTIVGGAGASSYMTFTPDKVVNRDFVNWNVLLPDVSCLDLLKDFFNRFAIIPKQTDDTLILKTLNEIIQTLPINWSSKLVNLHKKEISFKTRYAQENTFEYNDLLDDPELGQGSIDIDNNTLPLKKTLFKSVFGNTNTMNYLGWRLAEIPVFDGPAEIDGFEEGREVSGADSIVQDDDGKIVRLNGTFNFTIDLLSLGTRVMLRNTGAGMITLVEGSGVEFPAAMTIPAGHERIIDYNLFAALPEIYLYETDPITEFSESPGLRLLTLKARTIENAVTFDSTPRTDYVIGYFVDSDLSKDTGMQYFIDQFYNLLEISLQQNKIPLKEYNLTSGDVHGFDVHKTMYDGQGYYIVNKIRNYTPDKITKVELFRL